MCWNQDVSLNTFLFGSFMLALVFYNNSYTKYTIPDIHDRWVYLFFVSVISMQLIEFFIWRNIHQPFYNQIFTSLALLLLVIQPIVSMMMVKNIPLRHLLLISYLFLAIPYSIYTGLTTQIRSVISKNGHLRWIQFPLHLLVWVVWLFFFLFSAVYEKRWSGIIFGLITLVIAFINYRQENAVGSMWCWMVNSISVYYAVYLLLYLPFAEKGGIC